MKPEVKGADQRSPGLLRHSAHVSTEAKLTQTRYGTNRSAAKRLARQNAAPVARMSASRTRTSMAASAPRCHAKNIQDHSALAASYAPNKPSAIPLRLGERHTSHAAIPMSAYRTDHTGPNTEAGGAHDGLLNPA